MYKNFPLNTNISRKELPKFPICDAIWENLPHGENLTFEFLVSLNIKSALSRTVYFFSLRYKHPKLQIIKVNQK